MLGDSLALFIKLGIVDYWVTVLIRVSTLCAYLQLVRPRCSLIRLSNV